MRERQDRRRQLGWLPTLCMCQLASASRWARCAAACMLSASSARAARCRCGSQKALSCRCCPPSACRLPCPVPNTAAVSLFHHGPATIYNAPVSFWNIAGFLCSQSMGCPVVQRLATVSGQGMAMGSLQHMTQLFSRVHFHLVGAPARQRRREQAWAHLQRLRRCGARCCAARCCAGPPGGAGGAHAAAACSGCWGKRAHARLPAVRSSTARASSGLGACSEAVYQ